MSFGVCVGGRDRFLDVVPADVSVQALALAAAAEIHETTPRSLAQMIADASPQT
jgi:hypothetical protein